MTAWEWRVLSHIREARVGLRFAKLPAELRTGEAGKRFSRALSSLELRGVIQFVPGAGWIIVAKNRSADAAFVDRIANLSPLTEAPGTVLAQLIDIAQEIRDAR